VNVHRWVLQAHNEGSCLLNRDNRGFIDVILSYEGMELLARYIYGLNLHTFNLEVLNEALTFAKQAGMSNFESVILDEIREINDIKKFRAEFPKHVTQSRLFKLRNKAFNLLNQESLNKRTRESLEQQETITRQAAAEEARQSLLDQGRQIAQQLEQSRRDGEIRRQMMLEAIQKRQQGNE
jgi:hypothetical protein